MSSEKKDLFILIIILCLKYTYIFSGEPTEEVQVRLRKWHVPPEQGWKKGVWKHCGAGDDFQVVQEF